MIPNNIYTHFTNHGYHYSHIDAWRKWQSCVILDRETGRACGLDKSRTAPYRPRGALLAGGLPASAPSPIPMCLT